MMMKHNNDKKVIEEEVFKTLHCLDQAEKVKTYPFFYTRLRQKLDELEARETSSVFSRIYLMKLRPAILALLVVMNIFLGIILGSHLLSSNKRSENLNSIVEVYGLNGPDLNDYIFKRK